MRNLGGSTLSPHVIEFSITLLVYHMEVWC